MASEVLSSACLDTATRRIRHLCEKELIYISQHGKFGDVASTSGSLLWAIMVALKKFFHAETQAIEGLNSIIRIGGKRSPNISLELLASRLIIKRALGLHSQTSLKFSSVRPIAESLVLGLMPFKIACLAVLADQSRWAPAPLAQFSSTELGPGQVQGAIEEDGRSGGVTDPIVACVRETLAVVTSTANASIEQSMVVVVPETSSAQSDRVEFVDEGLWAKSYNLGYKWRTGGGNRKKPGKTTGPVLLSHRGPGLPVVAFHCHPKSQEADSDPIVAYFVVTDKFAHSVLFTRLRIERDPVGGAQHLVWDPQWAANGNTACIESTKMMAVFFDFCVHSGGTVDINSVYLNESDATTLLSRNGRLPLVETMRPAVTLLSMDKRCMKGVVVQNKRRPPKKKQPPTGADDVSMGGAEGADADLENEHQNDDEAEEDQLFIDDAGNLDAHSGDSDAGGEEPDKNIDLGLDPPQILEFDSMSMSGKPSASGRGSVGANERLNTHDVADTMSTLLQDGATPPPSAELEEEALLLLIRQKNQQDQLDQTSAATFEGVGSGHSSVPLCRVRSEASSSENDGGENDSHGHGPLGVPGSGSGSSSDTTFSQWSSSCCRTLDSFQFLKNQSFDQLGQARSISLVIMKPQADRPSSSSTTPSCQCVRCKWQSSSFDNDVPDLIWVSWLNVSNSHGLLGRHAREVKLDDENRVLFSVPDLRMCKTGFSQGYGYPQLLCDDAHCSVVIPVVGAAMKKITKHRAGRDYVHQDALRIFTFCEMMLAATAAAHQQERVGKSVTETWTCGCGCGNQAAGVDADDGSENGLHSIVAYYPYSIFQTRLNMLNSLI